jgi:hypothetical protein
MKNLFKSAMLIMFILIASVVQSKDLNDARITRSSGTMNAAEAQRLINRLEEIKAMDITTMTKSEKKALRKEVKASQKKINSNGGVYLSVGAVIIIILLLILLL